MSLVGHVLRGVVLLFVHLDRSVRHLARNRRSLRLHIAHALVVRGGIILLYAVFDFLIDVIQQSTRRRLERAHLSHALTRGVI